MNEGYTDSAGKQTTKNENSKGRERKKRTVNVERTEEAINEGTVQTATRKNLPRHRYVKEERAVGVGVIAVSPVFSNSRCTSREDGDGASWPACLYSWVSNEEGGAWINTNCPYSLPVYARVVVSS